LEEGIESLPQPRCQRGPYGCHCLTRPKFLNVCLSIFEPLAKRHETHPPCFTPPSCESPAQVRLPLTTPLEKLVEIENVCSKTLLCLMAVSTREGTCSATFEQPWGCQAISLTRKGNIAMMTWLSRARLWALCGQIPHASIQARSPAPHICLIRKTDEAPDLMSPLSRHEIQGMEL
jgi:hypothetical protein